MKHLISPAQARAILDARVYRQEGILPPGVLPHHGAVALANESLFQQSHMDVELTDYAVGYRDPSNIEAELDFLMPQVRVPDRFSFRTWDNAEAFLADDGDTDVRAIGSDHGEVEQYHNTETESRTLNKGLAIRIDKDQIKNMPDWQNFYVGHLRTRLLRCDLRRTTALIAAAAVDTAKTWDGTAGQDPDMDMNTQITSAGDLTGIRPNSLHVGETAWNKRWLTLRAQNNSAGDASAQLNIDGLAGMLGLARRFLSTSRYQSSASAKTQFAGAKVWLFFALDGATKEDASNTKNFVSPCDNGQLYAVYIEERTKCWIITVEHYSRPTITSSTGIRQLTIS